MMLLNEHEENGHGLSFEEISGSATIITDRSLVARTNGDPKVTNNLTANLILDIIKEETETITDAVNPDIYLENGDVIFRNDVIFEPDQIPHSIEEGVRYFRIVELPINDYYAPNNGKSRIFLTSVAKCENNDNSELVIFDIKADESTQQKLRETVETQHRVMCLEYASILNERILSNKNALAELKDPDFFNGLEYTDRPTINSGKEGTIRRFIDSFSQTIHRRSKNLDLLRAVMDYDLGQIDQQTPVKEQLDILDLLEKNVIESIELLYGQKDINSIIDAMEFLKNEIFDIQKSIFNIQDQISSALNLNTRLQEVKPEIRFIGIDTNDTKDVHPIDFIDMHLELAMHRENEVINEINLAENVFVHIFSLNKSNTNQYGRSFLDDTDYVSYFDQFKPEGEKNNDIDPNSQLIKQIEDIILNLESRKYESFMFTNVLHDGTKQLIEVRTDSIDGKDVLVVIERSDLMIDVEKDPSNSIIYKKLSLLYDEVHNFSSIASVFETKNFMMAKILKNSEVSLMKSLRAFANKKPTRIFEYLDSYRSQLSKSVKILNKVMPKFMRHTDTLELEMVKSNVSLLEFSNLIKDLTSQPNEIELEYVLNEKFSDYLGVFRVNIDSKRILSDIISESITNVNRHVETDADTKKMKIELGFDFIDQEKDQAYITFTFTDNGNNPKGSNLDDWKIFERGYTTNGTGVGLDLMQRVAEAHDGSFDLLEPESEGDYQGTKFQLKLPLRSVN